MHTVRWTGRPTARRLVGAVLAVLLMTSAQAATPTGSPSAGLTTWGETALLRGLAEHFSVPPEDLRSLRRQGLGIGELAILYSLAGLTGFDTADGVNHILELRASGMGWGEIARQLGIDGSDLGRAVADALRSAAQSADQRTPAGPGASARRASVEQELVRATEAALAALPEQARAPVAQLAENWHTGKAGSGGAPGSAGSAPSSGWDGPSAKGKPDPGGPAEKGPGGGGQGKGKP